MDLVVFENNKPLVIKSTSRLAARRSPT